MVNKNNMTEVMDRIMDNMPNSYNKAIEYMNVHKNLKNCIDMDKFINKIISIIDKSENFEFRSERAKKHINKNNPIFILSTNLLDKNNNKKMNNLSRIEIDKFTDKVTKVLQKQIIQKISKFLTDCITNKEDFDKLFKDLTYHDAETLLTSIYIIRLSVKDNCIYLSLFR